VLTEAASTIDPQWGVIIAASATALTAIGGVVLAFSVLLPTLRVSKDAIVKVEQVHQLVNSQHDALLTYQSALVGALKDADVVVPVDQSKPGGGLPPSDPPPAPTGPLAAPRP
jgi:hypothetical protein